MTYKNKESTTTIIKEEKFVVKVLENSCITLFSVARHTFRATAVMNQLKDDDLVSKSTMQDMINKYRNTKVRGGNS